MPVYGNLNGPLVLFSYPDNLLHERMEEGELLVQLEAVVHRVLLPDQLVADVSISLVVDDQLSCVVMDNHVDALRGESCKSQCLFIEKHIT